jgi:hypothetical protein
MSTIQETAQQVRDKLDAIEEKARGGRLSRAQVQYLREKLQEVRQHLEGPTPPRVHGNGHAPLPARTIPHRPRAWEQ